MPREQALELILLTPLTPIAPGRQRQVTPSPEPAMSRAILLACPPGVSSADGHGPCGADSGVYVVEG